MDGGGEVFAFWVLAAVTLVAAGGVMVSRNLLGPGAVPDPHLRRDRGILRAPLGRLHRDGTGHHLRGAIAVLILFAVLLTPRAGRNNGETRFALPGILLAVCLAAVFLFVVHDTALNTSDGGDAEMRSNQLGADQLGEALLTTWAFRSKSRACCSRPALVGAIMLARTPQEEAEDALA